MENVYRVAIHYNESNGYIEYAIDAKTAKVVLDSEEKRATVEAYLAEDHEINVPHETLMDFSNQLVKPLSSVEDLKLALTRLWGTTGVYVDWSRPLNV